MDITNYLKAGYPTLWVNTQEPERATKSIKTGNSRPFTWDCRRGIIDLEIQSVTEDIRDPIGALEWLRNKKDTVLMVLNFHHFLNSIEIIQEIQNNINVWKINGTCLIIVSPKQNIPQELEKLFSIIDFQLPSVEELETIQKELGESVEVEISKEAIESACGLTEFEAETAFALSLVTTKCFDVSIITEQKKQMIKKSGLMEFWPPVPIDQVGGLDNFKRYITNRKKAFEQGNEHLPKPKAILLVGIPGTGKSLSCKAAASLLNWPLIKLDISALKGSLVGESEQKIRQATSTIDAFGKGVIWMEEIEKTFAGVKSSGFTDSGTTANMFAHFLTWQQETKSPILIMATANNIAELPPELLRAGRFDAIFFVDLPNTKERTEIIKIMNNRYNSEIPENFADKLTEWSGAEIEQLAKDSLFDGIEIAYHSIIPLSKTMKEDINSLQEWAKTRARKANLPEEENNNRTRRIKT